MARSHVVRDSAFTYLTVCADRPNTPSHARHAAARRVGVTYRASDVQPKQMLPSETRLIPFGPRSPPDRDPLRTAPLRSLSLYPAFLITPSNRM